MENKNCRGQCALEVVMVLIVLTTVILVMQSFAAQARGFFNGAVLSKELGR